MSNEMNKEMSQGTDVQTEERYQVTKRDLRKTAARYNFMACNIFNYESQMGPAIAWAMAPVLRKIYKKDDEYKMALNNHFNYFNSTTVMSSMILGATLAVEEKDGIAAKDTVQSLKTSLMGPFAGIGDSFFQGTLRIITFGIGLSFAKQGSVLGPILAVVLFAIPSLLFAYNATFLGYESGNKYLAKLYQGGLMDRVMHFASIVGLLVVGGMVASMVNITTPLQFQNGGTSLVLQDMLNTIFPKLLPLVFTLGVYKLIQKKVNTNVLLIGIILFGLVMGGLGIL